MTSHKISLSLTGMFSGWLDNLVHWMSVIQSLGWLGWILFVVLYAASCLLFLPGSILTLGGGAVYGFWVGVLLVSLGNGLGALIGLLTTRYLFRAWAKKFFARNPKMHALQIAVEKEGWKIVCLTHLSPVMPFSLINYAYGITNISITEFILATVIGSLPATCIYVYLGKFLGNLAKVRSEVHHHTPMHYALQAAGILVTIAITVYISRLASQAVNKRAAPS